MMKRHTLALFALTIYGMTKALAGPATELVSQLPADGAAPGAQILDQLLKLGPSGIHEVVSLVGDPATPTDAQARFALNGLAFYVSRPNAEADRVAVANALLKELDTANDSQKPFVIRLLQLCGKDEIVTPLSKLLPEEKLAEPVVRALVHVGTPKVSAALVAALEGASDSLRLRLVHALGALRATAGVQAILPLAKSQDADLRRTALWALANIGDPAAVPVLTEASRAENPYDRSQATGMLLQLAARLAETAHKDHAVAVCRHLLTERTEETAVVAGALSTLTTCLKEGAVPELLAAAKSESLALREAALNTLNTLPGAGVTKQLLTAAGKEAGPVRAGMLAALGRRGDQAAFDGLVKALAEGDPVVRLAAAEALHRLAPQKAVEPLLSAMKTAEGEQLEALKLVLARTHGSDVLDKIAAAIPDAPAPARVALLQVLGSRRAEAHTDTLIAAAKAGPAQVSDAAFESLGLVADPKQIPVLVQMLLDVPAEAEAGPAQEALVRVSLRVADSDVRTDPVLKALQGATGVSRVRLVEVLGQLETNQALDALVTETKGADANARQAAFTALTRWPTDAALEPLLGIAKSDADESQKVLALRAYVRLVGGNRSRKPETAVHLYQEALAAATRADEKRLVISGLGQVRHLTSLNALAPWLDDETLREDACNAIVRAALPNDKKQKPVNGPGVAELLEKVKELTQNDDLRKRLSQHLASLPRPDAANVAQGKPVTTSVAAQGDHTPDRAVDGNATDRDGAAWFGAAWPSWLQVDLLKPTAIDGAQVTFYWDGTRYYQYKLSVSTDGQKWQPVVDASGNTTPAPAEGVSHNFTPVTARYVRLDILKNSANEAVHLVELKVFAQGKRGHAEKADQATTADPAPPVQPDADGFVPLFNGRDLTGWTGSTNGYVVEDGKLVCLQKGGGLLRTEEQYGNFHFKFEFKLEAGGNNGVGIRFTGGNPAYSGMEIQILDDDAEKYAKLQPYQYHGSIYGVVPAKRGHTKPAGQWNAEEIIAKGRHVTVILNGVTIVDADLDQASKEGTMDHKNHPGLKNDTGYLGFCGHGARVEFRNLLIKKL